MIDLSKFTISSGYILIENIEDNDSLKPLDKPDDTQIRIGRVLQTGGKWINPFGQTFSCPVDVGMTIAYVWKYNQEELIIDFKHYPIIPFDAVRGSINES